MKKLTLEERVTRLERAVKNEFIFDKIFGKKATAKDSKKGTAEDGDNLISSIINNGLLKKYNLYGGNLSKKTNRIHINIGLPTEISNKLNGLHFMIAAKGGKNDNLYCTAADNSKNQIATLSPIKFGDVKDFNNLVNFISKHIEAAKKKYGVTTNNSSYKRNNGSLRKRFEAMVLDGIEIGYLDDALTTLFKKSNASNSSNLSTNIDTANMPSKGFLTVTVSDDKGAVDYYVQTKETEDGTGFIVGRGKVPDVNSEELAECESLYEAAEIIHSDAITQFDVVTQFDYDEDDEM